MIGYKAPPGTPDAGRPANDGKERRDHAAPCATRRTRDQQSLNRAHETLLNYFTPEAITTFAQRRTRTRSTNMYSGCPNPGKKPWTESRTTLVDMAGLFETVENIDLFKDELPGATTRQAATSSGS